MKKLISLLSIVLFSSLFFVACQREDPLLKAAKDYLNAQETFGVYQNQLPVFVYDPEVHQLADNKQARTFRLQDDNQKKLIQFSLDQEPELGGKCLITVMLIGISGIENSYKVEVIKTDEAKQTLWLLDPTSKMGFVVFYRF